MPNLYHDETGKFCSKEEMGAAVDRLESRITDAPNKLAQSLAFDTYFELRKEYESINRSVVEVPEAWVGEVATSGLSSMPQTAAGIEAYYRSGFEQGLRTGSFHSYGERALMVLTSKQAPRWVKDEIYHNASVDIKAGLIQKLSHGEKYSEISSQELMPFTQGQNGTDWMVIQSLLASNRISFETKYDLAKGTSNLGTLIGRATDEAELYTRIPNLEYDLIRESRNERLPQSQRDRATQVVASNTSNPDVFKQLLADEPPHSYTVTLIARNPNLPAADGMELLQRVADGDAEHFDEVYEALRAKCFSDPSTGNYAKAVYTYDRYIKNFAAEPQKKLDDALEKVMSYDYVLDRAHAAEPHLVREHSSFATKVLGERDSAAYRQALATLDAQPKRYEDVQKETRQLEKEKRKAGIGYKHDAWLDANHERLVRARKYREASVLTRMHREHTDPRLAE